MKNHRSFSDSLKLEQWFSRQHRYFSFMKFDEVAWNPGGGCSNKRILREFSVNFTEYCSRYDTNTIPSKYVIYEWNFKLAKLPSNLNNFVIILCSCLPEETHLLKIKKKKNEKTQERIDEFPLYYRVIWNVISSELFCPSTDNCLPQDNPKYQKSQRDSQQLWSREGLPIGARSIDRSSNDGGE